MLRLISWCGLYLDQDKYFIHGQNPARFWRTDSSRAWKRSIPVQWSKTAYRRNFASICSQKIKFRFMPSKNVIGFSQRPRILRPIRFPKYAFVLLNRIKMTKSLINVLDWPYHEMTEFCQFQQIMLQREVCRRTD